MQIKTFTVGPFAMNCYIVSSGKKSECLLIDPGDDVEGILRYIDEQRLRPLAIVATHAHLDHVRFIAEVQRRLQIPFYLGEEDIPLLESLPNQGLMFNLPVSDIPEVSGFLREGQVFTIGDNTLNLLHTPGHSPGSFSLKANGHVFVGDVLFKESIGRTDLYKGNHQTLLQIIKDKILSLPEETLLHPGHGPATTVGHEKKFNPFLKNI